jgi:acylphosphatase
MGVLAQHAIISGTVQGVFFRQGTQQRAAALGLQGWVRNLKDGRVEVLWQGPAHQVAALRQWLRHGPDAARVDDVLCQDCKAQALTGFEVWPTADKSVR